MYNYAWWGLATGFPGQIEHRCTHQGYTQTSIGSATDGDMGTLCRSTVSRFECHAHTLNVSATKSRQLSLNVQSMLYVLPTTIEVSKKPSCILPHPLLILWYSCQLELPDMDWRLPTESGEKFRSSANLFSFASKNNNRRAGQQHVETGFEGLQGRSDVCPPERLIEGTHANHIRGKCHNISKGLLAVKDCT